MLTVAPCTLGVGRATEAVKTKKSEIDMKSLLEFNYSTLLSSL
jgi:hypothetical protein